MSGGSTGIGAVTAELLASRGAKVILTARDESKAADTLSAIKKAGGEVTFDEAEVSKEADVERVIARTVAAYGHLDVAVNNGGVLSSGGPRRTSSATPPASTQRASSCA